MDRAAINRICAALPGAECTDPWGEGHDCWKVGGKIFAHIGLRDPVQVIVKTAGIETAEMLIEVGMGVRAPYFHRSWIALPLGTDPDELRHRILASYRLIRETLPRKVKTTLAPF